MHRDTAQYMVIEKMRNLKGDTPDINKTSSLRSAAHNISESERLQNPVTKRTADSGCFKAIQPECSLCVPIACKNATMVDFRQGCHVKTGRLYDCGASNRSTPERRDRARLSQPYCMGVAREFFSVRV